MPDSSIAVIGTGLIGASVGLTLMAREDRRYEVVGVDSSRQNARAARELGAVDRTVRSLDEAVGGASMIVLATPPRAAVELLEAMAPHVNEGAIITDTCSTKAAFMAKAEELYGGRVSVVGGHPMAGSERSGPAAASADLFGGAAWAVTPSATANERSVEVVLGMIRAAGAVPVYVDPAEHDEIVAAVSHLPLMLSVALFRMVRDSACWDDAEQLAGPAFRDMTRLVRGDPRMAADIVATNRGAIVSWLRRFQDELDALARALELDDEGLRELLARADDEDGDERRREREKEPASPDEMLESLFKRTRLDRLVSDDRKVGREPKASASSADLPGSSGEMLMQMFTGAYLYDRIRQLRRGASREPRER